MNIVNSYTLGDITFTDSTPEGRRKLNETLG